MSSSTSAFPRIRVSLLLSLSLCFLPPLLHAFVLPTLPSHKFITKTNTNTHTHTHTHRSKIFELKAYKQFRDGKKISLKKAAQKIAGDPNFLKNNPNAPGPPKKRRRTRKRVEQPKQTYIYASQRQRMNENTSKGGGGGGGIDIEQITVQQQQQQRQTNLLEEMKKLYGYNANQQSCDPIIGDIVQPRIMAEIRVYDAKDEENSVGTNAKAYIIEKPVGWTIMAPKNSPQSQSKSQSKKSLSQKSNPGKDRPKDKPKDTDTDKEIVSLEEDLGYDMEAVLAMLTPEERAEMEAELELGEAMDSDDVEASSSSPQKKKKKEKKNVIAIDDDDEDNEMVVEPASFATYTRPSIMSWLKQIQSDKGEPIRIGTKYWTVVAGASAIDDSGLVLVCPKQQLSNIYVNSAHYLCVVGNGGKLAKVKLPKKVNQPETTDIQILSKLKKGRSNDSVATVSIDYKNGGSTCENVVQTAQDYFKDGIRGDVNGSPLDLRSYRRLIHCDGMSVSSVSFEDDVEVSLSLSNTEDDDEDNGDDENDSEEMEDGDFQSSYDDSDDDYEFNEADFDDSDDDDEYYSEGGTTSYNDLDVFDDSEDAYLEQFTESKQQTSQSEDSNKRDLRNANIPDDIAIWTPKFTSKKFSSGSFNGRSGLLRTNELTTAYREINGAADGYPGWIVDRYDKWLFIQHDETQPRGPIPSIHDGYTSGVHYFGSTPNRAEISSVKPSLLEGKPSPDELVILENGVKYIVNLSERLSSGIFLDQRMQRAWLTQNCNEDTRLLNCFAHCGAYSVAAASAGASTVSLDLEKKWLDRVEPQMRLNGITDFEERHDCIYGDCFDWLNRLNKRGEKFDIVILDPPCTSVGKKKKRWSVKNDMDELVALAAPLVKPGGLLWTTNNCSTVRPEKFARMCKSGLEQAGKGGMASKLERVVPMPVDFPSIGTQPVTNLVWRVQ